MWIYFLHVRLSSPVSRFFTNQPWRETSPWDHVSEVLPCDLGNRTVLPQGHVIVCWNKSLTHMRQVVIKAHDAHVFFQRQDSLIIQDRHHGCLSTSLSTRCPQEALSH